MTDQNAPCAAQRELPATYRPISIMTGWSLIHEPSFQSGIWTGSPSSRHAASKNDTYTVWILHNSSSVIIPHLLSMKRFCIAPHNPGVFSRIKPSDERLSLCPKVVCPHTGESGGITDSRFHNEWFTGIGSGPCSHEIWPNSRRCQRKIDRFDQYPAAASVRILRYHPFSMEYYLIFNL